MQEKEKMKVLKNSNYEIEDEKVEEVTGGCGQLGDYELNEEDISEIVGGGSLSKLPKKGTTPTKKGLIKKSTLIQFQDF